MPTSSLAWRSDPLSLEHTTLLRECSYELHRYQSICLSVYLSLCVVCLSISLSLCISLSVSLSVLSPRHIILLRECSYELHRYQSVCLCVSVYIPLCLSLCVCVCLCVSYSGNVPTSFTGTSLSVYLSLSLSVCLCVSPEHITLLRECSYELHRSVYLCVCVSLYLFVSLSVSTTHHIAEVVFLCALSVHLYICFSVG